MATTTVEKCRCARVWINRAGYDRTGSYWGTGDPLYRVEDDATGVTHHYRAVGRWDAIEQHAAAFPGAKFYRGSRPPA